MLLRNFTDRKGRLWAYDKRNVKLFSSTPNNLFAKRDLYTRLDFNDAHGGRDYEEFRSMIRKSYEYENILGRIESRAAPTIKQIIKEARHKECPKLSAQQSDAWKRFALALSRRTPESQQRASSNLGLEDVFFKAATIVAEQQDILLPTMETLYMDPRVLGIKGMVESNVSARFSAGVDPRLSVKESEFCRDTGLAIAVIRESKKQFIIGSHGISRVESNSQSDPAQGDWFPIAHDVAVTHTPNPTMEYLLPLNADNDYIVDRINGASAEQSRLIAGRSENVVRSFM